MRAKMAFLNCKITQEETAINFLTRLEQKANEARNFDIKISEKRFISTLLNNMKYHRHYKERIASFLTATTKGHQLESMPDVSLLLITSQVYENIKLSLTNRESIKILFLVHIIAIRPNKFMSTLLQRALHIV